MIGKLVVQTFLWFGFMGALMFLSAGTLRWTRAWVYLVVMVGLSLTMGVALARRDPGLMNERLRPPIQKTQTAADKILLSILLLGIFGWLALMGFDFRFGWSQVSAWVQVLGALVLLVGIWICYLTMLENSFAAPVVKIQDERGQHVITTGPYRAAGLRRLRRPCALQADPDGLVAGLKVRRKLLPPWRGPAAVRRAADAAGHTSCRRCRPRRDFRPPRRR